MRTVATVGHDMPGGASRRFTVRDTTILEPVVRRSVSPRGAGPKADSHMMSHLPAATIDRGSRSRSGRPGPLLALLVGALLTACGNDSTAPEGTLPPALGPTIFIDPDIITADDATAFLYVEPAGTGERVMFDRRVDDFVTYEARLFDATFDDGLTVEIQVNPEFDVADALAAAEHFGAAIGRLPAMLRADVATVWIHRGMEPFGGGNDNILIHTGQADAYEADGILEEALIHEATHTSLDAAHATAPGWVAAQDEDDRFISQYAMEHPVREDLAETLVPYIAVQYRSDRITDFLEAVIRDAIPARIDYLDAQSFDMHPIE